MVCKDRKCVGIDRIQKKDKWIIAIRSSQIASEQLRV